MFTLACHTWSFPDLTLAEALGTIARAGFRMADIGSGVGWNAAKAGAQPLQFADELRADLGLHDLAVSDLYLMLPRISFAGEGDTPDQRRGRELALFAALLPFAKAVGAAGITVSPGILPPKSTPEMAAAAFETSVEALTLMQRGANAVGIPLSFEPHLDSVAPTPAAAFGLLEAVPGIRLTLDWAEMVCQNVPHDQIVALLPHTRHIHMRQATRNRLGVPFDKGTIDLTRMVNALVAANYTGSVTIEMIAAGRHGSQKLNPLPEAARTRDALRDARNIVTREPAPRPATTERPRRSP